MTYLKRLKTNDYRLPGKEDIKQTASVHIHGFIRRGGRFFLHAPARLLYKTIRL